MCVLPLRRSGGVICKNPRRRWNWKSTKLLDWQTHHFSQSIDLICWCQQLSFRSFWFDLVHLLKFTVLFFGFLQFFLRFGQLGTLLQGLWRWDADAEGHGLPGLVVTGGSTGAGEDLLPPCFRKRGGGWETMDRMGWKRLNWEKHGKTAEVFFEFWWRLAVSWLWGRVADSCSCFLLLFCTEHRQPRHSEIILFIAVLGVLNCQERERLQRLKWYEDGCRRCDSSFETETSALDHVRNMCFQDPFLTCFYGCSCAAASEMLFCKVFKRIGTGEEEHTLYTQTKLVRSSSNCTDIVENLLICSLRIYCVLCQRVWLSFTKFHRPAYAGCPDCCILWHLDVALLNYVELNTEVLILVVVLWLCMLVPAVFRHFWDIDMSAHEI